MFYLIFIVGVFLSFARKKKTAAKIFTGLLAILAIFRYGMGADYFAYQYLFSILKSSVVNEFFYGTGNQELGFRLFGVFLKQFGISYQIYLSIFACISLYFIYKLSIKYSENPTLALTIYYSFYYFVWIFSGIRQGLVISVGIYYLLQAIKENKIRKFFIVVLLLSFIHLSAIFLIVLFFVSKLPLDKNKLIILSVISVIFSVIPVGIVILRLSTFIPVFNRIIIYANTDLSFNSIFEFQTIGRLVFMTIVFVFYDKYVEVYPEDKKILNMYLFCFIVYFIFQFSELTAARLAIYGKVLDILILSNLIYVIKTKWNKVIVFMLLITLMSMYLFKELNTMEQQTGLIDANLISTPYVNIFNKDNFYYDNCYFINFY